MQHLRIAKELIAYQTDGFKDRLVALFEELYANTSPASAQASKACAEIQSQLFKRFGLKISLVVDTELPPMVLPIMANPNHVLSTLQVSDLYVGEETSFLKVLNQSAKPSGTIDLKKAKVDGAFSKLDMPLMFSFDFIKDAFSPGEAAAVLLHEVGHCFLAFEFMFRTYRASQLLAALHQVKSGRDTTLRYEYAIDAVAERLFKEGLTDSPKAMEALVSVKNDAVTASVVYTRVWSQLANDFGSNPATAPNFEALADNFVVRFGLGKELASGLKKFDYSVPDGLVGSLIYAAVSVIPMAVVGGLTVVMGGSFVFGAAVMAAFSFFIGGHNDSGLRQANVHDNDFDRITRIQQGVITGLKNPKLDARTRQALTTQSIEIGKMIQGRRALTTLWDDLANIAFTERRNAKAVFKLERDIEALASSNLFVGASLLKNAA